MIFFIPIVSWFNKLDRCIKPVRSYDWPKFGCLSILCFYIMRLSWIMFKAVLTEYFISLCWNVGSIGIFRFNLTYTNVFSKIRSMIKILFNCNIWWNVKFKEQQHEIVGNACYLSFSFDVNITWCRASVPFFSSARRNQCNKTQDPLPWYSFIRGDKQSILYPSEKTVFINDWSLLEEDFGRKRKATYIWIILLQAFM